jgi:hypothetical protein
VRRYFGGAGANPSRLRPGSGFGFGLGAFLTSFLPLSLLPMGLSVTQKSGREKSQLQIAAWRATVGGLFAGNRLSSLCVEFFHRGTTVPAALFRVCEFQPILGDLSHPKAHFSSLR